MHIAQSQLTLTLDPLAFERCFLVADIFDEIYSDPFAEYGLLGLSAESDPFHVVATPLLHGQAVTRSSVFQGGHDVLRMRREFGILSEKEGESLIPMAFIHRHPGGCQPSAVDKEFLSGVLIDQVSTAHTFHQPCSVDYAREVCRKCHPTQEVRHSRTHDEAESPVDLEFAVCFSLIVNRRRQHSVTAARKEFCGRCADTRVQYVPAQIQIQPERRLTHAEKQHLRSVLELEIAAKVHFAN